MSGGAAAERVNVARQLEALPQVARAFAQGDVGFQHVALIARVADNLGSAPVQKEQAHLLKAAQTMDPGRFAAVAKGFEQRVDAAAAWRRPTTHTSGATFTSASRRTAWSDWMGFPS